MDAKKIRSFSSKTWGSALPRGRHAQPSGAVRCAVRCRGIVLGVLYRLQLAQDKPSLTLDEVFDELLAPLGVPVLSGVTCGHSTPTLSLPIGCDAELNT